MFFKKQLNFEEALEVVGNQVVDILHSTEESNDLFEDIEVVTGIDEYLHNTLNRDVARYFAAKTDEERAIVRGAFARTSYFLSQLRKARARKQLDK